MKLNQKLFSSFFLLAVASAQASGGITAGGGGSLPSNPATPAFIKNIIEKSRSYLYLYFNKQSFGDNTTLPGYDRLFGGRLPIQVALMTHAVHIETKRPCFDPQGRPWDGSAPGPVPNSICISLKTLSEKLTQDNAFAQTLGLVAHEYSHLVGFNEAEADRLQNKVVNDLTGKAWDEPEKLLTVHENSNNLIVHVAKGMTEQASYDPAKVCRRMESLISFSGEAVKHETEGNFKLYGKKFNNRFADGGMRRYLLWVGTCAIGSPEQTLREYFTKRYDEMFKGQDSIGFSEVLTRFGDKDTWGLLPLDGVRYQNFVSGSSVHNAKLKEEWLALKKWSEAQLSYIQVMRDMK